MLSTTPRVALGVLLLWCGLPPGLSAQRALSSIGGEAEERDRLEQLTGAAPTHGLLLRSPSSRTPRGEPGASRWALLAPDLLVVSNANIPFSLNDGALWAGTGLSVLLRGGLLWESRRVRIVVAPEVALSQNRRFPGPDSTFSSFNTVRPGRDPYSSPFHFYPASADVPWRMGREAYGRLVPGQSSVTVTAGAVAAGAATENQWWGPGVRNALLMSNSAEGVPHLFLRTARPITTPFGAVEARWMTGGLSESEWFDSDRTNDLRWLSGLAATLQLKWEPDLTLGFARVVFGDADGWGNVATRWFGVFRATGRPNAVLTTDSTPGSGPDELTSLFARWVFPSAGTEVYAEWGRQELPGSLRELFTNSGATQAYTLGLQWTRASGGGRLRLQAEATYAEKGPAFRDRAVGSWYTSRAVPQGYTQRGQSLGAAIGPGASSQWLAVDWFGEGSQAGVFAGRVRWDNDALLDRRADPNWWCVHDFTVLGGVRGGMRGAGGYLSLSVTASKRTNLWFQYSGYCPQDIFQGPRLERSNLTVEFRYSPATP